MALKVICTEAEPDFLALLSIDAEVGDNNGVGLSRQCIVLRDSLYLFNHLPFAQILGEEQELKTVSRKSS